MFSARPGESGDFRFRALDDGHYEVRIELDEGVDLEGAALKDRDEPWEVQVGVGIIGPTPPTVDLGSVEITAP